MPRSKALSHTTIYALGNVISNIVSIVMLPIYTRYLTPADYGVAELLNMALDIFGILIGMRVGQAMFRYYTHAESPKEAKQVISTALWISVFLNTTAFAVILIFSTDITTMMFDDTHYERLLILYGITLICQALIEVPLIYLRAVEKPWLFFFFGVLKLVLQVSLNIYFVVYLELHVAGVVYSALISLLIMAAILTTYTIYHTGLSFSRPIAKLLVNFSFPILLTTVGSFVMTYGDRFYLQKTFSVSEVGIYALAYKFGFMMMILSWTPFSLVWDTIRYEIYRRDNAIKSFQQMFMYVTLGTVTIGIGLALYVKPVIQIMAAPEFHSAAEIAPIVLIAYLFFAWTNYCNFGIYLKEKTKLMFYAEVIAVIAIVIAYSLIIPRYGAMGAAWATVIGFLVRLVATELYSVKLYDMKLPWLRATALMALAIAVYLLSYFSPEGWLLSVAYRTLLVVVFFAAVYVLPILQKEEKTEVLLTVTAVLKKIPLFNKAAGTS